MALEEIQAYTLEDFIDKTSPYEFVYSFRDDEFQMLKVLEKMAQAASKAGFRGFKKQFKAYCNMQSKDSKVPNWSNTISLEGQPAEDMDSGQWRCDEMGVTCYDTFGKEIVACDHPILPIERLVNIDTGVEKLRIAFLRGKKWRSFIVEKSLLGDPAGLAKLADKGISVNRRSAVYLSDYFKDMESLNYERIDESQSVSRLGWIDDEGFSPYCGELKFDGDANFKSFFESVKTHGSFQKWLDMCKPVRKGTVTSRISLAASFASSLVKPLGGLPFFVHLWGGTETGKSVSLMLAASVWADPAFGSYIHTFNSTSVGKEMAAAFVNSMPLILDELQISRNRNGHDEDIYKLAEGVGRTRSNKSLGLNKTATWANCIITSGEMPITNAQSGGGAVNRILEIECKEKLFADARAVADASKRNYGYAGKLFVEKLQEDGNIEYANRIYQYFYHVLSESDATEKQAMAAAIVLTGDALATEWIFCDSGALSASEIKDFLQSKEAVSANGRGYQYMCEWVARNAVKFEEDKYRKDEVWGSISDDGQTAYIISSVFRRAAEEAGYNSSALLSYLKHNGLIQTRGKANTIGKRINKILTECVAMQLPQGFEDITEDMELPF